jgi:hypothetical protein
MGKSKKPTVVSNDTDSKPEPKENANIQFPNIEELKGVLAKHPHVHTLHIDAKGNYHFQHRPGFEAYTREDILNG